jgi:hypothetical protein
MLKYGYTDQSSLNPWSSPFHHLGSLPTHNSQKQFQSPSASHKQYVSKSSKIPSRRFIIRFTEETQLTVTTRACPRHELVVETSGSLFKCTAGEKGFDNTTGDYW